MVKNINDLSQIAKILHLHPFIAPRLLQNPHFQTAFARLIPYFTMPMEKPERRFIEISDGTKLAADCWFQKDKEKHATVVFLNGFEGYSKMRKTNFARTMSMKAFHFGFNAIHLKQRGETDTIHLTKSFFTAYSGLNDVIIALRACLKSQGVE